MRITQEADYAVRIIDRLAVAGKRMDARCISESTGVTLRFTLKILRKLSMAGVVKSFKGVTGGYELAREPFQINLRQVIEAVDGPIIISRCLSATLPCSKIDDKKLCYFHNVFADVSQTIRDKLESVTFGENQAGE
jgi:Rrf2 family transcriptional regulator, iron-sulfur cluster assembly transcription factor